MHLRIVLVSLRRNEPYAKLPKFEFNKPDLQFLGHIVGRHGIWMDPAKTAAIQNWPVPKDVHQLRSFIGVGYLLQKICAGLFKAGKPCDRSAQGARRLGYGRNSVSRLFRVQSML